MVEIEETVISIIQIGRGRKVSILDTVMSQKVFVV